MKKHSATKPRLFDDIVADQDLRLPGLEYFFGRERGMHKLADYAKPHFEKLIKQRMKEAINAIDKIKSDIQDQYNKELKDSRNKIAVKTTKPFLNALVLQDSMDYNKVRGLKTGILVHNMETGMPMHVLPNQYLFYRGETTCYFPKNKYREEMTKKEIGNSFYGAFAHKNDRLRPKPQKTTQIMTCSPYRRALMILIRRRNDKEGDW